MQATLRDELGEEMEEYLILGARNPRLALNADRRIELLLPCNVVIRTDADGTVIEVLERQTMVAVAGEPTFQPVADEAATRLRAALDIPREAGLTAPRAGSPSSECHEVTNDTVGHDHRTAKDTHPGIFN